MSGALCSDAQSSAAPLGGAHFLKRSEEVVDRFLLHFSAHSPVQKPLERSVFTIIKSFKLLLCKYF